MIRKTISLAMVAGLLFGSSAAMAAAAKTKADHLAEAAKYEKLATDEQAVVKEHTAMKADYRADQSALAKQTREKSLSDMDKHCDAIIAEAKKLADEYSAMAQWHKLRAEESEK